MIRKAPAVRDDKVKIYIMSFRTEHKSINLYGFRGGKKRRALERSWKKAV